MKNPLMLLQRQGIFCGRCPRKQAVTMKFPAATKKPKNFMAQKITYLRRNREISKKSRNFFQKSVTRSRALLSL